MKFVSHRGAAGLAKENTADSILIADRYHPRFIEVDIHRTADDVWVLYHGDIRRIYTGKPLDKTYKQLKLEYPTLLTLDELVAMPIASSLLLDMKVKDLDDSIVSILDKAPKNFRAAFTSPHIKPLIDLQKRFPHALTYISQPYHEGPYRPLELAIKYRFTGCNINKWWMGPITYHMAMRANKELLTYTIDNPMSMRLAYRFFPEVTIVSNHPERCIKI